MSTHEVLRLEEGMICAEPKAGQRPPFGDVVALAPIESNSLSLEQWPDRAARLIAAHNAFDGFEIEDFAQLIEDAKAFRWFAPTDARDQNSIESLREEYRASSQTALEFELPNQPEKEDTK